MEPRIEVIYEVSEPRTGLDKKMGSTTMSGTKRRNISMTITG
jgi:hypothetical protein